MANSNFIVHNGLQVGPLTIFAGNGDISTSGNVNISGTVGVSSINKNDSSIAINDTGSSSTVVVTIDGTVEQTIDVDGIKLPAGDAYYINSVSVLSATALGSTVASAPGLTSIGSAFTNLTAQGNLTVVGNLTVQGNTLTVGSNNLTVTDSIIDLHTPANLQPLISDDGRDIGFRFHYYKGSDDHSFFGWENATETLVYLQRSDEVNSNITGTFGNVQFGSMILANTTAATTATSGALQVRGGVGISGNVFTGGWIVPTSNTTQNLGTTTSWWGTFYGVSTQARYADLAENYLADLNYEPGTVLAFGGAKEVTIAGEETARVAGIVSTNPAHLMNGALKGSDVVALALQGRVPCRVIGPIRKGDMMVSAGYGYAKSSSAPKLGSVIGKALEDFDRDKGVIEIVVGRL